MSQQQQRYRVIERIASGGMAEVYRAESAGLEGFKKVVAIKRVLPHLSEKKKFIGMFLDEARVSARLSHSNCVQVFDIGVGDNTYFIVMEFVDGADLKAIVERYREHHDTFPPELACLICIKICEGLDYAHRLTDDKGRPLGIVHRDMSPPNVLMTRYGEVKIVDFGLAKANSQLERSEPGIIKGKFSYLSPEAAQGYDIDHRTDIFAVGIILWEMLAGRRLFLGESDLDTVRQVQRADVPPASHYNQYVTPELDGVLLRALARDPNERYQSAQELANDLTQILFQSGRPVSSFDIAQLVRDAMEARHSVRQAKAGSIIGSLIEEALFEFTSLEGDGDSGPGAAEPSRVSNVGPDSSDFAGPMDWAASLGDMSGKGPASGGADDFSAGSLADLLEKEESMPPPAADPPSAPEAAPAPVSAPSPASDPASSTRSSGGGKGGLVALILLLVIVGGAAGAYFGGLIPQDVLPRDLIQR